MSQISNWPIFSLCQGIENRCQHCTTKKQHLGTAIENRVTYLAMFGARLDLATILSCEVDGFKGGKGNDVDRSELMLLFVRGVAVAVFGSTLKIFRPASLLKH